MPRKFRFFVPIFLGTLTLVLSGFIASTAVKDKGLATAYLVASKLTDPLCQAHQFYRQILLVDTLYPSSSLLERMLRKGVLLLGSVSNGLFSLCTTFPAIELRLCALAVQEKPFLYFRGDAEEENRWDPSLSLLSWNLCCVSGGYSITDGGVLPWRYRIFPVVEALRAQNADILCLYEIFDIQTALALFEELKGDYRHFYLHIGPNAIGLSSGLFVASKVSISEPEFIPFPKESFDGRAKHCKKGFFSFELKKGQEPCVRVYATHLQHSEQPEHPTQGELRAREQAMEHILTHMQNFHGQACVLTGDLNLEEEELHASRWGHFFDHGLIEGCGCTWGGDAFCSNLTGKPISPPLNLDHTLVTRSSGASLKTYYVETGFNGETFNPEALSDHKGLLSILIFGEALSLQSNKNEESNWNKEVGP